MKRACDLPQTESDWEFPPAPDGFPRLPPAPPGSFEIPCKSLQQIAAATERKRLRPSSAENATRGLRNRIRYPTARLCKTSRKSSARARSGIAAHSTNDFAAVLAPGEF